MSCKKYKDGFCIILHKTENGVYASQEDSCPYATEEAQESGVDFVDCPDYEENNE